jgi:small conductance mechanosensitive channel
MDRSLRVLLIIAIVLACAKLIGLVCRQILKAANGSKQGSPSHAHEREKRLSTVVGLIQTTLKVLLYGTALLMILREIGLDITPLLTGAGIAGVAVGFGAQSLVKDVISGFFILLEDQIRVGDVIKINAGLAGSVERMELRVTAIRDGDGTLHIIPNGEIKSVSNMTYEFAQAVVDVPLPYETDLKKLWPVLEKVASEFELDPKWKERLSGRPEFVGITKFDATFMVLQIAVKTEPHGRWAVAGELRRRVKLALDGAGIVLLAGVPLSLPRMP